jgi:3-phenylpropionate/trans-cinnamate dioxygenase ferredoxin reductase subunit
MARDAGSVVIVGAGIAGYNAAMHLRALGHAGTITLVDQEPSSYDRPPLSKSLFDDDFSIERLAFASADELAAQQIDTRFDAAVTALDAATRQVQLSDGTVLHADTVLIATGGSARQLPISGAELPGVSVLRTFHEAIELRETVTPGTRVAVIGAGLIGAELASALRLRGAEVTLIDPVETPLVPAVGELLAAHLHAMHASNGVRTLTGLTTEFAEADDALQVTLQDGTTIAADRIVVGVGIIPNEGLAREAGLETDNGIIIDQNYRTSIDGVVTEGLYAAGDVARFRAATGELMRREEHWEAAQMSGKEAAYAMLGLPVPERGASWFWSDRHGYHLEATGRLFGSGEVVVRESGAHPAVFLLENGLLQGAAAIDDNMLVRAARRLIDQRIPVTAEELADPTVQLRSLLKTKRSLVSVTGE